jgi:hypothetical protein
LGADEIVRGEAGELALTVLRTSNGLKLQRLEDLTTGQNLLAHDPLPLFNLTLRRTGTTNNAVLEADKGWQHCEVIKRGSSLDLSWSEPTDSALGDLKVVAKAVLDKRGNSVRWKLNVVSKSSEWGVWQVVFPQLALADPQTNAAVLFPRGPGVVWHASGGTAMNLQGSYPDGWCTMQFMAVSLEGHKPSGLYLGAHDPWGSFKTLRARSISASRSLRLEFEHPAPNMGIPGNGFALEGEFVWGLLRGDWFDAAMMYKAWAAKHAKWWPKTAERKDSPQWLRELNAWAMTGGAPSECVPQVKAFREFIGEPIGFHWYRWHQVPFDNDYPHYFPTKEGFAGGVAELKAAGVYPMPYINGRLWDTHDRGSEDYQFTTMALPWATKQPDGTPFVEKYNSKETNQEPVSLAVMCPSSPLWQNTVSNIVFRLTHECGNSGVYIDQIAAAPPKPCMDKSHGHPLGGGHWWMEGYWDMLHAIRKTMPRDAILTTECNSEPFVRWFDGYLTWHWQFDGQVPAFPAIYGGQVQMFGRAYKGGATKDLALRMKAGQQLVFGEQLGWIDPSLIKEKENAEFFRQLTLLRSKFSHYFAAGQMMRPPKLLGEIPRVKADWQWSGVWWVTTDAVLTGAWRLPKDKSLLLLFVNVSDAPMKANLGSDLKEWGIREKASCSVTSTAKQGASLNNDIAAPISLKPFEAQAWLVSTK